MKLITENLKYFAIGLLFLEVLCPPMSVSGQPMFRAPRANGILQIRGDHAELRIIVAGLENGPLNIRVAREMDTGNWVSIAASGGTVDTTLALPIGRYTCRLDWQTSASSGSIVGLSPGHVFGIAGQSNAEGFTWGLHVERAGDVRMLKEDGAWQPAAEPTGNVATGPWLEMANILWSQLNDSLPIGIVNAAVGGTGITQDGAAGRWHRNPELPEDSGTYGRALRMFRDAGSELEALCWIQGEADGVGLSSPAIYQVAFKGLVEGFENDLRSRFDCFHLQIAGNRQSVAKGPGYAHVREAQRALPRSTLVGTAVGRSIQDDGVHFTSGTTLAVARMFAGAILEKRYGRTTESYPPLCPLDTPRYDPISRSILVTFRRGALPASVDLVRPCHDFMLTSNKGFIMPDQLVVTRSEDDPATIRLQPRDRDLDTTRDWWVSYVSSPASDQAAVAQVTPTDTLFAVSFENLAVLIPGRQRKDWTYAPGFTATLQPNPAASQVHLFTSSTAEELIEVSLIDAGGRTVDRWSFPMPIGEGEWRLPIERIANGSYWMIVRSPDQQVVKKLQIAH